MRSFLDDGIAEHKSKPPLRWIANWAGSRASAAVMRSAWLDEYGIEGGIRHAINETIYKYLWPIFRNYGTLYRIDWNDYDDNGTPYWERTGMVDPDYHTSWDYEDDNGDAFRVIRK